MHAASIILLLVLIPVARFLLHTRRLQHRRLTRAVCIEHVRYAARAVVVLGSGGHTAEMLTMIHDLVHSESLWDITYISTSQDTLSVRKTHDMHADLAGFAYRIVEVPRARRVKQPWITSIPTAIHSLFCTARVLYAHRPEVVLLNGPGTAAITGYVAILFNTLGVLNACVIYVESLARVTSLSLSGRLLYPVVDRFLVQWPDLAERYALAEFHGRLC